ncbi:hypothetical protein M404DRAFT_653366 [Pisolithus tinctorius Marx 270]|uniref:Uncharacterized protein n=1 Tax=Pisolithus tinctorius Marx 270 TaxID=870435 RepID=A0A0C3P519_PISTI|nr:hypothetical protein M404DRAFT_653366 [Pisolithus tinctorius Marx 270]
MHRVLGMAPLLGQGRKIIYDQNIHTGRSPTQFCGRCLPRYNNRPPGERRDWAKTFRFGA